jgi:gamma-glutamylcyclotransferase (GGCT)/AIG2-like uncharacterized protein YtfP
MSDAAQWPWLLFVYGTLRPEATPAALRSALGRTRRLGLGRLPGRLYHLGGYPAFVPEEGCGTTVRGEVLGLPRDPSLLALLDDYEGHAFERVESRVLLDSGQTCRCWVYVYTRDPGPAPVIASGDYLAPSAPSKD